MPHPTHVIFFPDSNSTMETFEKVLVNKSLSSLKGLAMVQGPFNSQGP
jgi:hypothetical protein